MKGLKKLTKQIALALVMALMVSMVTPAAKVQAAKTEETTTSFTVEVGENSYLEYEETDSERTAVYYVDGVATQKSVYNLETGVILYYDLSQNVGKNQSRTFDMKSQNVIEYHIDDFMKTDEKVVKVDLERTSNTLNVRNLNQTYRYVGSGSKEYSYLDSYSCVYDGETYNRYLYGYEESNTYKENYWFFEAGVAISAVSLVLGPNVHFLFTLGVAAAGVLVSAISVIDWIQEFYWKYKFVQTTPNSMSFVCPDKFVYLKKKLVEINGEDMDWERSGRKAPSDEPFKDR